MEWNSEKWDGRMPGSEVSLAPPVSNCNIRAMWLGYWDWTTGGEGFGMRLDKPLEAGKTYTFSFTYASDGFGSDNNFSPKIYTAVGDWPDRWDMWYVGRLSPATAGWKTDSITFKAEGGSVQALWIIAYAYESSGIVLSQCQVKEGIVVTSENKEMCYGTPSTLSAPEGSDVYGYSYEWSTGESKRSITVYEPGRYTVNVSSYKCLNQEKVIDIAFSDCEVRLVMPNIFTPNTDEKNRRFLPIEANYIATGEMTFYNRWGQKICTTDLFNGWDGVDENGEMRAGVYFYEATVVDNGGFVHQKKGVVELKY